MKYEIFNVKQVKLVRRRHDAWGDRAADYKELIGWWNRYAGNRPLYIGEDVLPSFSALLLFSSRKGGSVLARAWHFGWLIRKIFYRQVIP